LNEKAAAKGAKSSLFHGGGRWAQRREVAFYLLWKEYLAMSPSYDLARRMRAGQLPAETKLPDDFEAVLSVYDDLGDVRHVSFDDWWVGTGMEFFGHHGDKPRVGFVATLSAKRADLAEQLQQKSDEYVQGRWVEQGKQRSAVVAIPLGLTKAQVAKQVAAILDQYPENQKGFVREGPKYMLNGTKLDSKSLFKYIACLWLKAAKPDYTLWQIGAEAKLSTTYSDRLRGPKPSRHQQTDDRTALKILTSRALNRGHMIAENAARGIFPSYAKCEQAMPVDYPFIQRQRVGRHRTT
jgi:hypothetical protein